jgi:hypothetical protein
MGGRSAAELLLGRATGHPSGIRLLSAAVVVEFALLATMTLVRQPRREHVLALIANGRHHLLLDDVARQFVPEIRSVASSVRTRMPVCPGSLCSS